MAWLIAGLAASAPALGADTVSPLVDTISSNAPAATSAQAVTLVDGHSVELNVPASAGADGQYEIFDSQVEANIARDADRGFSLRTPAGRVVIAPRDTASVEATQPRAGDYVAVPAGSGLGSILRPTTYGVDVYSLTGGTSDWSLVLPDGVGARAGEDGAVLLVYAGGETVGIVRPLNAGSTLSLQGNILSVIPNSPSDGVVGFSTSSDNGILAVTDYAPDGSVLQDVVDPRVARYLLTTPASADPVASAARRRNAKRVGARMASSSGNIGSTGANGCRTVTRTHHAYTLLGSFYYDFSGSVYWCWHSATHHVYNVDSNPGWNFSGTSTAYWQGLILRDDHNYTYAYGDPISGYAHMVKGRVDNCIISQGCISTQYPYVSLHVHYDGTAYFSEGT